MSLLEVAGLTKRFGGLLAVDSLSLSLEQGEIVGLIGPNGAGKTTVFSLISGFLEPTVGTVTFGGKRIDGLRPHQVCELGMTRTFQVVQPFPDMTTLDNVMVGAYARLGSAGPAEKRAREVLRRTSLLHKADNLAKSLTLLELKRLEIAKALATEPRVLLLDEVAAGLKSVEVEEVLALVRQLNAEGISFLIVEHVMQVIMSLSQRIVVLNFGRKIAEGTPAEVSSDRDVLEAYLGEEEDDA